MNIGVAVADSPLGPFADAKGGPLISDSTPNSSPLNIEPTVFLDDDGQAFLYWGGYWAPRAVRLASNMIDTVGSVVAPQGLTNFWEATFMFKCNGLYYMMYAANDPRAASPRRATPASGTPPRPTRWVPGPTAVSCSARSPQPPTTPGGPVQRPVVCGLPQRQRSRRRQLPPFRRGGPDVLQR
ncbi:family 43 glycosylhydrolase [Micromonospora sp. NPDC005171]|uniref:family 43 glycosylhydrolase n=1 Tax=Micromonospora sp. NPDC005171 TaxID=3156866 RepID=UPI0033BB442C